MIALTITDPLVPVPAPDRRRNVRPGAPPPPAEPHCVVVLSGDDRRQLERAAQVRSPSCSLLSLSFPLL